MQNNNKHLTPKSVKKRKKVAGYASEQIIDYYFELLDLLSIMPHNTISLHQLMASLLDLVIKMTKMEAGAIYLKNDFNNIMELFVQEGFSQEYIKVMNNITIGSGFSGRAAQTGKVRISQLREGDPRFIRPASEREGFQCFISIPFRDDGLFEDILGILNMGSRKDIQFSNDTLALLRILGKQIGNKLANYKMFKLLSKREKWAEGLYSISVEIQSLNDVKKICRVVSEEARLLFESDFSIVVISNDKLFPKFVISQAGCIKKETSCALAMALKENFIEDLKAESIVICGKIITKILKFNSLKLDSLCMVPVHIADTLFGFIALGYSEPKNLNEEKKELERLSNQLAAAIYNAQLYLNIQELTAIKERNWIAREMHDSIAQELGAARMEIAKVKNHIANKDKNELLKELNYIDNILKQSYDEVRENILGLRTKIGTNDIVEVISAYLQDYSMQTGININSSLPSQLTLNPNAEVQLIRILQEALSNVKKHSQATRVTVELKIEKEKIVLTIKDNGCGFSTDNLSQNHLRYGLTVMKERAEALEGKLYLNSQPGKGTEVRLEFSN